MSETVILTPEQRASKRYESRKWRGFIGLVVLAVVLDLGGKLTPLLVDFLKWTFGLYCGFNVTQRVGEMIASAISSKGGA